MDDKIRRVAFFFLFSRPRHSHLLVIFLKEGWRPTRRERILEGTHSTLKSPVR